MRHVLKALSLFVATLFVVLASAETVVGAQTK